MSVEPVTRVIRPEDVEVVLRGEMPLGVREYTSEKVAHVSRLSGRQVRGVRAVVEHSPDPAIARPFRVEVTMDVAKTLVRAEGSGTRPREAVDEVVDRLERQVVRVTEKWQDRSRWLGEPSPGTWRHGAEPTARPPRFPRPAEEREVIRRKTFAVAPQTADEAAFDMEALGHDFYLFVDVATGADALVHRRDDGRYGVVGMGTDADLPDGVVAEPGPAELDETQARHRLEAGGEPFVFHRDPETGRGAVVYLRYDGHYGVITPT